MASLLVARIGRPHGLRGEVTVQVHTDDPERRLAPGARLATEAAPGTGVPRELTVATSRLHRSIWLVGFAEIPDRTGAEGLRGTRLVVETEEDWAPGSAGEDAWYERELVGLAAFDPAGEPIGEVTALRSGPQDQLVLRLPTGTRRWCRSSTRSCRRSTSPGAGSSSTRRPGSSTWAAEKAE